MTEDAIPDVSVDSIENDSMADYDPQIFENRDILRPTYVPDMSNIVGRDDEIKKLEQVLQAAAHGDAPGDAAILSKPGTGKTLCAKNVVARVRAIARSNDNVVATAYINCENEDTETQVAHSLAESVNEQVGGNMEIPENGVSAHYYYKRLFKLLDKADSFIPVLDEVDKLGEEANDVIKTLADAESDGKACYTGKVVISNKTSFYDNLDPRVQSRFQNNDTEMVFTPYEADELREILRTRTHAFKDGVLTDDVVPLCAAFGAQEHGDARKALDMLLSAGNRAQNKGKEQVEEEDVRAVHEDAIGSRKREVLIKSKEHAQYAIFALAYLSKTKLKSGFSTGEIRNVYEKVARIEDTEPQTHQNLLNHLKDWAQVELTENRYTGDGEHSYREHTLLMDPDKVIALVQKETLSENVLAELQ